VNVAAEQNPHVTPPSSNPIPAIYPMERAAETYDHVIFDDNGMTYRSKITSPTPLSMARVIAQKITPIRSQRYSLKR